jgi:alpha-beta hydrolase superfamily lysophospholipase
VVTAGNDTVNPPEQGRALYEAVGATEKKLHEQADARHYDMYSGQNFDQVIGVQLSWFRQHL